MSWVPIHSCWVIRLTPPKYCPHHVTPLLTNMLWLPSANKTKFRLHDRHVHHNLPQLHLSGYTPPEFPMQSPFPLISSLLLTPLHPEAPSTRIPAHICHLKRFPTSSTSTNSKFSPTTKPLNRVGFFFSLGGARAPSPGVQQSSCFLEDEMLPIFHACGLYVSKGCQCWYSNLPFLLSSIRCNWWQPLGLIF